MELDPEQYENKYINDDAFEAACYAAADAHHAGMDPHDQLRRGIQAYLVAMQQIANKCKETA